MKEMLNLFVPWSPGCHDTLADKLCPVCHSVHPIIYPVVNLYLVLFSYFLSLLDVCLSPSDAEDRLCLGLVLFW